MQQKCACARAYDYQTDRDSQIMRNTRLPAVLLATKDKTHSGPGRLRDGEAALRDATRAAAHPPRGRGSPLLSIPLERMLLTD